MTQTRQEHVNPVTQRRWLYGFNAAVLIVIALVIAGFVGYLTTRWNKHWDWTSSGMYSLSPSTKSLLAEATSKGQKYELISVFSRSNSSEEERQREQIMDVLQEYGRTSTAIKVNDASELTQEELERRIRTLYADELKPYETTIGEFDKLAEDLKKFYKQEAANIGAVGQTPNISQDALEEATILQGSMDYGIPKQIDSVRKLVTRLTDSTSPEWAQATETIKRFLDGSGQQDGCINQLKMLSDAKKLQASPPMTKYLTSASERYKAMIDKLSAYSARLSKLGNLKSTEILGTLKTSPNSVVVLGPTSAKVVGYSDLFQYQAPTAPGQDTAAQFTGEQAISSAILSLERPEKMKVVFITASPSHPATAQFSEAAHELELKNFEVLDWSPPGPPMGGPPPEPNPPAQGKNVVWVVFPPEPPNMQMMRMGMPPPNPAPVLEATRKHMDAGGQVLFLADAGDQMSMMMSQGAGYPYQDLLKNFGVNAEIKYTVLRQVEGRNQLTGQLMRRTMPVVQISRYTDHPITKSVQSLDTLFAPLNSQGGGYIGIPTVVTVAKTLPQGVEAKVIIESANTPDYWGESNMSEDAVYNKESDIGSPVPLAVAAIRNKGQADKEQRVVVIGSSVFASNPFLQKTSAMMVANRIIEVRDYPGNSELFTNSVLWLAGYENMIAVSAKSSAALRIADIPPGKLLAIRLVFFYLGLPIAALVLGGIVWFVRRK